MTTYVVNTVKKGPSYRFDKLHLAINKGLEIIGGSDYLYSRDQLVNRLSRRGQVFMVGAVTDDAVHITTEEQEQE